MNLALVEKTLTHFYKKTKEDLPEESPERTTTKRSFSNRSRSMSEEKQVNLSCDRGGTDSRKETSLLLQKAKRAPQEWQKVTFSIDLPYDMLIEQIQF